MAVHFAKKLPKEKIICKPIFWITLVKCHIPVNIANIDANKNVYLITMWKGITIFPIKMYFWNKSIVLQNNTVALSFILQNLPIKLGYQEYGCPCCPKISKRRDYMQKHILSHTGEKPHSCNFCDYRCTQKAHLNAHMKRNHTIFSWNWLFLEIINLYFCKIKNCSIIFYCFAESSN